MHQTPNFCGRVDLVRLGEARVGLSMVGSKSCLRVLCMAPKKFYGESDIRKCLSSTKLLIKKITQFLTSDLKFSYRTP